MSVRPGEWGLFGGFEEVAFWGWADEWERDADQDACRIAIGEPRGVFAREEMIGRTGDCRGVSRMVRGSGRPAVASSVLPVKSVPSHVAAKTSIEDTYTKTGLADKRQRVVKDGDINKAIPDSGAGNKLANVSERAKVTKR